MIMKAGERSGPEFISVRDLFLPFGEMHFAITDGYPQFDFKLRFAEWDAAEVRFAM